MRSAGWPLPFSSSTRTSASFLTRTAEICRCTGPVVACAAGFVGGGDGAAVFAAAALLAGGAAFTGGGVDLAVSFTTGLGFGASLAGVVWVTAGGSVLAGVVCTGGLGAAGSGLDGALVSVGLGSPAAAFPEAGLFSLVPRPARRCLLPVYGCFHRVHNPRCSRTRKRLQTAPRPGRTS